MEATALPDHHLPDDGTLVTTHIARPCWLYAWTTTTEDGLSWLSIYRSAQIEDDDAWLDPVRDGIEDSTVLAREQAKDAGMMSGRAALTIYEVPT